MIKAASTNRVLKLSDPIYLTGYISEERTLPIIGFLDDILCIINLLEVDQKIFLFVSIDVCMIDQKNVNKIKSFIQSKYGIDFDQIFLIATHTHSGPSGLDSGDYSYAPTREILEVTLDLIDEMLKEIMGRQVEVVADFWQGMIQGVYDNRNCVSFDYDASASILRLKSISGQNVAMFATFNCHPTVYGPNTRYATSDIIGQVRENLNSFYGTLPLIFLGACGDVSNRHFRKANDYCEVKKVGKQIADQMRTQDFQPLEITLNKVKTINFDLEFGSDQFIDETNKFLVRIHSELLKTPSKNQEKILISEKKILEKRTMEKSIDIKMDCVYLDLGFLRILSIPGELDSTFGISLKAQKNGNLLWLMTLTNGYVGYLTDEQTYGAFYESIVSPFPKGQSDKIIKEIGEKI